GELAKRGKEAQKNFCRNALKLFRQMYMLNLGEEELAYMNPTQAEQITSLAKRLNKENFSKYYDIFNDTVECIERNVNAKFIFSDLCNNLYLNT
ncbi:MAG: hypothetical protein IK041_01755, partial [Bacteroidales bacterium]|nr:hypothetical protein [Bacteroidales bacterium]